MNDMESDEITKQINRVQDSMSVDEKEKEAEIIRRLKVKQFRVIRQEEERSSRA
jgi:hypothetical protein